MMSFVQRIIVDSDHHEFPKFPEWCKKDVVGIVTFDPIGLLPTNDIIILQWHTGVYKETFNANIENKCLKVESTEEMVNLIDYLENFIL